MSITDFTIYLRQKSGVFNNQLAAQGRISPFWCLNRAWYNDRPNRTTSKHIRSSLPVVMKDLDMAICKTALTSWYTWILFKGLLLNYSSVLKLLSLLWCLVIPIRENAGENATQLPGSETNVCGCGWKHTGVQLFI